MYFGNGVMKYFLYRNLVSFVLNDGIFWLNSSINNIKFYLYYDVFRKIFFDK